MTRLTHAPATTCAFAIALSTFAAAALHAQTADTALLGRADASRARGAASAPLLVHEITDFQCPQCARFAAAVWPLLDSAYVRTGRVQWVLVNLPLPSHGHAWTAAEAALCAGATADRFWELREHLFARQDEWSRADDPAALFTRYAREAGVRDVDAFAACVGGDLVAPILIRDVLFAAAARVGGTPTFVINNSRVVVGLKSFVEWRDLLEAMLRADGR